MARTVSLSTLRSDVRTKADIGGARVRHTDAQLTRYINQAIQEFRRRISDDGSQHYLVSASGALGVGPTGDYQFYQLDLSALSPALVRTYGIDVNINGEVLSLEHIPFEQRSKYGSRQNGRPLAWAHFRTDQVAIFPPSSEAHTYIVWYLPKLADLSADGDTFDGVEGWEDLIVWDVVCQVIARDQFPQAYQIAEQRRQEVEQKVIRGATKVTQAGGAHTGRDSFGTKLTYFLGSRRPTVAAAGGPVTPTQDSVTVGHLAHFAGPAVIGVPSGTTDPIHWHVASLTSYLTQFNTLRQGVVPLSDGLETSFLAGDGVWRTPAGGGVGNSAGPSGAVQYQAGTGFAGASGFRIFGNSPSLIARLEGSMRVTGGQVEVGSGTVRVSASGIDVGGGAIVNVGTLVASSIAAQSFTASVAGLAPASGGGTDNFLRADGTWNAPPGGSSTPGGDHDSSGNTPGGSIQYITAAGTFGGTVLNRLRIMEAGTGSGVALGFGAFAPSAIAGTISVSDNFLLHGYSASGTSLPFLNWREAGSAGNGISGAAVYYGNSLNSGQGIQANVFRAASGGFHFWQMGSSGLPHMVLRPTGLALPAMHLHARSITVFSGIPNDQLTPMASGTVKGQMGPDGVAQDIPLQSLTTALYQFDSGNRGVAPASGGGSTNFLRADGEWAVPPGTGGSSSPGGDTGFVQYRDAAGGFQGASGITIVASGQALLIGHASGAPTVGEIRFGDQITNSIVGLGRGLQQNQTLWFYAASGLSGGGNATGGVLQYGRGTGSVQLHRFQTAPSGSIEFELGPSGTQSLRFLPTGVDFRHHPLAVKSLRVVDTIPNSELATMSTGTVKANLSGNAAPSDVPLATLLAFAPTFTATRAGIVPESGGGAVNFLRADGTWNAPSGAHQFPPSSGVTNAQMATMATGTIKGNLAGTNAPADVPFATFMAFAPTFTSVRMGVVPASGGGTTNFLRADGTWAEPPAAAGATPGAAVGAVQFNNGAGGFGGASGVNIVASGRALAFGVPSFLASSGDIRVASGGLRLTHGPGGETVTFLPTGVDLTGFHVKAKSLDVEHINGLPWNFAALKRFSTNLITDVSTGLPSGLSLYPPRGAASGGNRLIIPSGAIPAARTITVRPTGGRAGEVIRIERNGVENFAVTIANPTGTVLHVMPSGTKSYVDLMFGKPSGVNFELGGHGDMF